MSIDREIHCSVVAVCVLVFARAGNLLAELLAEIFNCSASRKFSTASSKKQWKFWYFYAFLSSFPVKIQIKYLQRFHLFSFFLMIKKSSEKFNFFIDICKNCLWIDGIQPESKRHAKLEISIELKSSQKCLKINSF